MKWTDLAKMIGNNIAVERLARRISQDELARKVHVARATISRIENGHRLPPLDVLVAISDVLYCPLNKLLWGLLDQPQEVAAS